MKSFTMRNGISTFLLIFVLAVSGFDLSLAQAQRRDSVVTRQIEPGLIHSSIFKQGPFALRVLTLDRFAAGLHVESYRTVGLVQTTRQALRNNRNEHRVIAAINADFFSFKTGWPVNDQIVNGQFVEATETQRSHLALDDKGKAYIERFRFDGWVKPKSGRIYEISGINEAHRNNAIVLHNCYSDTATDFKDNGMLIQLRLANSSWSIGDTLRLVVNKTGDIDLEHIPTDQAVLWVGGGSAVWGLRDDLSIGDTLVAYLGILPRVRNVRTMVGGAGMIVADGKPVPDSINLEERMGSAFLTARHPRTFVGFDRDTTKIIFCTVDGRQPSSLGMNYKEMAEFLLSIGVWNAINLDGGGSTTMVIDGKIVNSPSDKTGERPVANTLQIIKSDLP